MKYSIIKLLLAAATILTPGLLAGQAITTQPAFPTEDQSIEITFDVSMVERTELEGFNGDVFAHTGVIISEEDKNSGAWSFVIAGWDTNIEKARMTNVGENLWQITIEDIREFYNIPNSVEKVFQLAFVLRDGNGTRQTEDLFVDLADEAVNVRTLSPEGPATIASMGEPFQIVGIGNTDVGETLTLSLVFDDQEVATAVNDTLRYTFVPDQVDNFDFTLTGVDEFENTGTHTFRIVGVGDVVEQQRPTGIEDGVNDLGGGSVILSLFAPEKENVFVIGDFTDWQPDADFFMKRDFAREDSVHYWLQIDGLPQNEDVRFQYLVDGNLRIADPFSEMVLDPVHDPFLPQGVFPDLPAYPTGFTTEIVSVMRPGRIPYEWQVTDFERPAPEELVIYELLLRDFVEESTYTVLKDTLDYLERLGVNAIELMPVSQFDGNNSWGYNPVFHGALEKSYGTRRAFKEFVDEAHSRGMAVILDVVYNHAHENSPLIRLYGLGRQNNRFIGPGHAFNVFQHLNHDDPYIHYWLDRMNRYWLETFKVDGYRFDLTKGFATNVQDGGLLQGPNPERIANLKRMNNAIREFDDTAYVILEHFADNFEERQLEAEGMLLWGNHNFNYSEGMMGFNSGGNSNMSGIYFGNRNFNNPHLIGYMESHDEQWMMLKMRKFGNQANPEHNPRDLNVALDRMKLAGAFFFTIPGPKMLWQFGELGYGWGPNECLKPGDGTNGDCLASDPGRTAPKPVRWDYFNDPNRQDLYNTWADLLFMRSQSPAFTSGDTQFESFLNGNTKWIKLQHPDMDAVIIGNFDLFQQDRSITFTQSGTWYEFLSNDEFVTDGSTETFTLAPGSFKIFTTRPLSVFTSTESDERIPENPQAFELSQNYPNPFNPTTQIQYTVPQAGQVKLEVFDMLGRRVTTLVNTDNHPSGQHTVTFDASGLSSGVYLTRLSSASQVLVRKMTLIK